MNHHWNPQTPVLQGLIHAFLAAITGSTCISYIILIRLFYTGCGASTFEIVSSLGLSARWEQDGCSHISTEDSPAPSDLKRLYPQAATTFYGVVCRSLIYGRKISLAPRGCENARSRHCFPRRATSDVLLAVPASDQQRMFTSDHSTFSTVSRCIQVSNLSVLWELGCVDRVEKAWQLQLYRWMDNAVRFQAQREETVQVES